MRYPAAALAAAILACAAPASAEVLISFHDNTPDSGGIAALSDTGVNWATTWTQNVATSNVTVRALLGSNVGPQPSHWWITTSIGLDANESAVLASGDYTAPNHVNEGFSDFNPLARTELASGLNFAAGTYYLVLDGPGGPFLNNVNWILAYGADTSNLASGFSLGASYVAAAPPYGSGAPNSFAPASPFTLDADVSSLAFELESLPGTPGVPEPAAWALMIVGFGLAGASLRRRGADVARRI
jgi:hypothetical protein